MVTPLPCEWCHSPMPARARPYQRFCHQRCRQAAFRLRQLGVAQQVAERPMRFAYADPPYPGRAWKYYRDQPTYAGEVDHAALIASLEASGYDGWALSTSEDALATLLPLCPPPPETRVCPWVKPIGVSSRTRGAHNTREPLIVVRGRKLRPGFRDWLLAQPARGGGSCRGVSRSLSAPSCSSSSAPVPATSSTTCSPGRAWSRGRGPSCRGRLLEPLATGSLEAWATGLRPR